MATGARRVLVTGGTGFIGANVLEVLLGRFDEVHAVSRKPPGGRHTGVRWHTADLLDEGRVSAVLRDIRPTDLLHLAWSVEPGGFWSSAENALWVEVSGRLVRTFAEGGGKRVVCAGTCAEYDWSAGKCIEASTVTRPASLYGAAKHALQISLDSIARETGLSAAWGRVFLLYGPREHPDRLVASVIRSLLRGEAARTTAGTQRRDFLHVEDVAHAFVALLSSDVEGPVNIGSGTPVAVREVVTRIAQTIGRENLLELGAIAMRPDEPPLLVADTARLTRELGWVPRHTLQGGLDDTIAWWRGRLSATHESECV